MPGVPLNTGSQIPHIDVQYRYSSVQVTSTHSLTSVKVEFSNGAQQTWSPGTTSGTFTGSGSNAGKQVRKVCAGCGIDHILMDTSQPLDAALSGYLALRSRTVRGVGRR